MAASPPATSPPRLLLVSTQPWNFGARLAYALRRAGCHVEGASPPGALMARSSAPAVWHRLRQWRLEQDLAAAIARARPDRVVPCDDRSAALIAGLHGTPGLRPLVESSLGDPAAYPVAGHKSAQMALAARMGLPVPSTLSLPNRAALDTALANGLLPRVLKTDGSWGGAGVIVLRDRAEAGPAWDRATARPGLLSTAKLAAWERSIRPFFERRRWRPGAPDLQDFVPGRPANRAVLVERGQVIAGLSVEVLHTISPTGPASVVRVIDHPDMTATAAAMAERLGLSGFLGFDFVLEEQGGRALMLEMNPRATPICHLAPEPGGGLASAFFAHLAGRPVAQTLPQPGETIALFPGEWLRDPESCYLDGRHDVPWHDPPLLRSYLDDAAAAERFARLRARLRGRRA
jgi:hypothetical protein